MKFIVSSSQLHKQLQSISGILNSNNTLPILDNFLFEIKSNKLIVSASDLETTMTTEINNTEASEEGSIAIPSKLLLDILKTFSDQPLTFLINKENFGIEIGSDNGNYKLVGQNGEEFPKSPILENPSKTIINSKNKGVGSACNIGVKAATKDYVFIVNPDILVGIINPLIIPLFIFSWLDISFANTIIISAIP